MPRRREITHWELGHLFGATVVRGYLGGRRVTMLLRWWSHGRFGLSSGREWVEEVVKIGRPAPTAFADLE